MSIRALIENVTEGRNELLVSFLQSGGDANAMDTEWNCPIIFHAVLVGNIKAVEALVQAGANVNQSALEPGCSILAESALSLAMQCSHLQSYEKFNPIVQLLEKHGAKSEI